MFVLFEESGKFLSGRVLSQTDSSLQVDLDSGKRVKVKAANALLQFEQPQPAALLTAAQTLCEQIDLPLAWEFASEEEFGFADLARDYFQADPSQAPTLEQQTAALFCLFGAPHYFRRAGKGRFKKAPAQVLQQALAAIEKKAQITAQIDAWGQELVQGQCPAPIEEQLYKILFKPDKNSAEYKAVVQACRSAQTAPLALLQKAGAITSPYQFHYKRFLFENFPTGTAFPALPVPPLPAQAELPLAKVQAFSIDDSSTTEIDDALSVQGLGTGTITLGIHIAAPGLAIQPSSAIDGVGRARMSTVYMPGHKLTMLPDDLVQSYTLQAGRNCPALSLYLTLDEASLAITQHSTRIELVPIASNLRHDQLDNTFTEAFFQEQAQATTAASELPWAQELTFLYRLAKHLKAQREVVRGKPETFNRPDYSFKLDAAEKEPQGNERVSIGVRRRGAPLDLIVAEAMILANSTWGQWLAEHRVPGIYRSQASMAPGVKVRMGTKALPHAGLGVPSYCWSTSPLRRYTDLVNQWQIMACAQHRATAALAAPFKPKDADLFSIISCFDSAYAAYHGFQANMERYWTLKYLEQNQLTELTATAFKDNLVRADDLPLVFPALGAQGLPRGTQVRVQLGSIDFITLDITGTVLEQLGGAQAAAADLAPDDELEETAGPLSIAVDVDEPAPTSAA